MVEDREDIKKPSPEFRWVPIKFVHSPEIPFVQVYLLLTRPSPLLISSHSTSSLASHARTSKILGRLPHLELAEQLLVELLSLMKRIWVARSPLKIVPFTRRSLIQTICLSLGPRPKSRWRFMPEWGRGLLDGRSCHHGDGGPLGPPLFSRRSLPAAGSPPGRRPPRFSRPQSLRALRRRRPRSAPDLSSRILSHNPRGPHWARSDSRGRRRRSVKAYHARGSRWWGSSLSD